MKKVAPSLCYTGGPCAGKTTILSCIADRLMDYGYNPFMVPEAATLIIGGNIKYGNPYLQKAIYRTQMHFFKTFNEAASHKDRSVILHDRGVLDNLAYMDEEKFRTLILPQKLEYLRDSQFKGIIHLQTAAIDAEKFYTLRNNTARSETLEEARGIDQRLLQAWNGHPKHVTIANKGIDFEQKKRMAVEATLSILGIPVPIEDEQKFLIDPAFAIIILFRGLRRMSVCGNGAFRDIWYIHTPLNAPSLAPRPTSKKKKESAQRGIENF